MTYGQYALTVIVIGSILAFTPMVLLALEAILKGIKRYITGDCDEFYATVTVVNILVGRTRVPDDEDGQVKNAHGMTKDSEGALPMLMLWIMGISLGLAAYYVGALVLICWILLRLARFVYRLNKTFNSHKNDKGVHKC